MKLALALIVSLTTGCIHVAHVKTPRNYVASLETPEERDWRVWSDAQRAPHLKAQADAERARARANAPARGGAFRFFQALTVIHAARTGNLVVCTRVGETDLQVCR